jgi:hypothetical protein
MNSADEAEEERGWPHARSPLPEVRAMNRFACPTCRTVLECPGRKAGEKVACPKCGQRLQVPGPEHQKTVLGQLVDVPSQGQAPEQGSAARGGVTLPSPRLRETRNRHPPKAATRS